MDLELINETNNDTRKMTYTLTLKAVEKQPWKEMGKDEFTRMLEHPKLDMTSIAKLLMERVANQYLELQKLRDQLVDKVILEDQNVPKRD